MAIITQAALTSLRNLKYGNDQPGNGSSGEPYVTQPLPPAFKQQVESTEIWKSDGELVRGGFAGASRASILDTKRIGKFFKDAPKGPLFLAKQVGLQLSNPKLETRSDLVSKIAQGVGATRIYNAGINTLAQVPLTAFGLHIARHGFSPILGENQKYASIVKNNDAVGTFGVNNRLVKLKTKLENNRNADIDQYVGGPNSLNGLGITVIRRYDNTLSNPQYNQYLPLQLSRTTTDAPNLLYKRPIPNIDYFLAQGVSEQYFDGNRANIEAYNNIITGSLKSAPSQIDQNVIKYSAAGRNYDVLKSTIDTQVSSSRIGTANIIKDDSNQVEKPITFSFTGKASYKNNKYKDGLPLNEFNIENRIGVGKQDEVNKIPLYVADGAPGAKYIKINNREYQPRDLIKFRIEAVDNDAPNNSTWMIFRAYLKDITDSPNPTFNTINYIGRGEPFYIYNGFERNISFTFQVAALSEGEMKPMWQKLNYLYSNTMPDYSGGLMRTPYIKLTIGNYVYRQPGIIKSLTYTVSNDSPWEIAIDDPERGPGEKMYELPHVMSIQMTFAPIHNFLPRKFPTTYEGEEKWQDLPGFVVDRVDNKNEWLTSIFNQSNTIPQGTL